MQQKQTRTKASRMLELVVRRILDRLPVLYMVIRVL